MEQPIPVFNPPAVVTVVLPTDPAYLSTAQQKKISFKTHRVFTNKRVAAGMKIVRLLAQQYTSRVVAAVPHGTPVALFATFYYAYPKGTPKKHLVDEYPMPSGADLDNRFKSVGDALTQAGWWADDRAITTLVLKKRRTTKSPRIELAVTTDLPPMPKIVIEEAPRETPKISRSQPILSYGYI
jgi:Holliday junction resolvase RusA-like endonuclease